MIFPESEVRKISISRSIPGPKGSLSILILPYIYIVNYCVYCIEDQNPTQYNAQKFFNESKNLIGIAILYDDIELYHQSIHGFWTGLYQQPSLYRGIVKVMWRVFNQLNVCFNSSNILTL